MPSYICRHYRIIKKDGQVSIWEFSIGSLRQTVQPSSVYSSQTHWRGLSLTCLVITEVERGKKSLKGEEEVWRLQVCVSRFSGYGLKCVSFWALERKIFWNIREWATTSSIFLQDVSSFLFFFWVKSDGVGRLLCPSILDPSPSLSIYSV